MFLPVHGLLADEAGDPFLEFGIGDAVGETADRSDEAFLAGRKCTRQTGDEVAEDRVAGDEVLPAGVLVEAEADSSGPGIDRPGVPR